MFPSVTRLTSVSAVDSFCVATINWEANILLTYFKHKYFEQKSSFKNYPCLLNPGLGHSKFLKVKKEGEKGLTGWSSRSILIHSHFLKKRIVFTLDTFPTTRPSLLPISLLSFFLLKLLIHTSLFACGTKGLALS